VISDYVNYELGREGILNQNDNLNLQETGNGNSVRIVGSVTSKIFVVNEGNVSSEHS
jgi:hypothetical protein